METKQFQAFCLALPGTTEDLKWGCDLCFCVAKKMYAVLDISESGGGVSFKTTPDLFDQLVQQPGISPAPYLARYAWVRLEKLDVLPPATLEGLVRDSYALVVAKLPAKLRREHGL